MASIVFTNVTAVAEVWILLRLGPVGAGFPIATGGALATFGVVGLVARLLLGPVVGSLLLTLFVGGALYALVLWFFRGSLELSTLREAMGARLKKARVGPA